ncbi:MAG TPA: hypothetical protein VGK39_00610 [Cyclobacteriaceae bacterium]
MFLKSEKFLKISNRNLRILFRYLTEVLIIFIGITISFAFEQWREDQREKKALIELTESLLNDLKTSQEELKIDYTGSRMWVARMDSIRIFGPQKKLSPQQLQWFYAVITGQEMFLFKPYNPTYTSASTTSQWNQLPDTIRSEIYRVNQHQLRFLSLLYDQQQENITHFRLIMLDPTAMHLPIASSEAMIPDYEVFSTLINQPNCQNLINQILVTEKMCYIKNEVTVKSMAVLEKNLEQYLELLRDS